MRAGQGRWERNLQKVFWEGMERERGRESIVILFHLETYFKNILNAKQRIKHTFQTSEVFMG